jgi:DNA polymerase-3 subunit alpha/error-prone DNA polymerase
MAKDFERIRHLSRIRIAGLLSHLQKPPTAKGMCFVSLEDETGLINVVITPDLYQKVRMVLMTTPLLEVDGVMENREGVRNIKAQMIRPLLDKIERPQIASP